MVDTDGIYTHRHKIIKLDGHHTSDTDANKNIYIEMLCGSIVFLIVTAGFKIIHMIMILSFNNPVLCENLSSL